MRSLCNLKVKKTKKKRQNFLETCNYDLSLNWNRSTIESNSSSFSDLHKLRISEFFKTEEIKSPIIQNSMRNFTGWRQIENCEEYCYLKAVKILGFFAFVESLLPQKKLFNQFRDVFKEESKAQIFDSFRPEFSEKKERRKLKNFLQNIFNTKEEQIQTLINQLNDNDEVKPVRNKKLLFSH
jgi:hypothetical protein